MSIRYRPEIDGLRAIAVLAVLLCHAGIPFFAGGYVGVDVFFVISGYLITSLIVSDLKAGTFSFVNFWERRARRILPPLAAMVAVTAIAGWFLFLPTDYAMLGEQMAAQAVFSSNILFKLQAGYFDVASTLKPLLHTWSLAVEEQFYLFFPIAMFWIWKLRPGRDVKYLGIFAAVSFIAAAFLVRNSPDSAFYYLPFRAWELLVGSLIALKGEQIKLSSKAREGLGFAGIIAILLPVFIYSDKTLFPGATALLPCLGAAAIILSNAGGHNAVGKLLALRGSVFVGLISYSLYLWHWPIICFVKYSGLYPFTPALATVCIAASFLLAVLSWKFIETPVRKKVIFPTTRQAYIFAGTVLLAMGVIGFSIYTLKGIPQRLPAEVAQYAAGADDINPHRKECNKPDFERFETDEICQSNPESGVAPTFMLWGDSYADAMATAFYDLSEKYKKNGYIVTAHGCPPILGFAQAGFDGFDCPGFNERVLKLIDAKGIKHVVLIGNWTDRMNNPRSFFKEQGWYVNYKEAYPDITSAALKYTIDELQKRNIKVYLMFDVPYASFNPPRFLAMKRLYHADDLPETISRKSYMDMRRDDIDIFAAMNATAGIVFVDPVDSLCDAESCKFSHDGQSLYFNEGHLSTYGSRYLAPLFEPYFENDF